jgi:hypothetical protein
MIAGGEACVQVVDEGWGIGYKEPMGLRGEIFSARTTTGRRTYFFNVKENRTGDVFLNLVESKKNSESDFERHSIIVFKEDLESFMDALERAVRFIRGAKS